MSTLQTLEQRIEEALGADRHRLRRQLRTVDRLQRQGKPYDRTLGRLAEQLERSIALRATKLAQRPSVTIDPELPIAAHADEIRRAIRDHQVVVICGETGSGKSTQLPKLCLDLGRGVDALIGHTQPRRIAARSIAARLADELSTTVGEQVGFKIRFTDTTSPTTFVKLMTDGMLLAETQHDRFLDQYDTLILDEAHERSLNIDFLLGYLKRLLPRRPDLRVIVTSATLDAARFAEFFAGPNGPAPVIEVSGRGYPVELRYRPPEAEADEDTALDVGLVEAVQELAALDRGDILVFLPTEREIREAAKLLRGVHLSGDNGRRTEILPLYARLSTAEQNRVFQTHAHRRIVLATNVAESSLTVPGIRYVVDTGTARISRYSPRTKLQRLPIEPVSQASADQRAGRCGRIGPGVCIRLYSEQDYLSRDRYTTPEIRRTNLASVILQAKVLDLGPIEEFPFLDPPRPDAIRDGYQTLFELGAIDERNELTEIGRRLSRLPVDPRIGRMILAADQENCLHEMLIVAAALEVQDPRVRPHDRQEQADQRHAELAHPESDFLSYLQLWDFYQQLRKQRSRNQLRRACQENFLSYHRLREWIDVHRQLRELTDTLELVHRGRRDDVYEPLHRALLAGLLSNIAYRSEENRYTGAGNLQLYLWPGSALYQKKPKWVVAGELVETSRQYLRTVARIHPEWVEPLAEHLVRRSYSEIHWSSRQASAMAYERVSLFGLPIVTRRRVRYTRIDPGASRELLLRHGLVEGQLPWRANFLEHNERLLEEVKQLGAKSRRQDFVVDEEARFRFYEARVPKDVCDGQDLERWLRRVQRKNPRILHMTQEDLLETALEEVTPDAYPDQLEVGSMQLPLEYHYEPGSEEDGVTVKIPKEALNQLDPDRLDWLVPGLLEQRIAALIRGLPKPLRRGLIPVPDKAREIAQRLEYQNGPFVEQLARELERIGGEPIPRELLQHEAIPEYLRMNIRVVDEHGKVLAQSRDLAELRQQLGLKPQAQARVVEDQRWHRDGVTQWDFGPMPENLTLRRGHVDVPLYPALLDRGDSVALRLLDSPHAAQRERRRGLCRLFFLAEKRELRSQVSWMPNLQQWTLHLSGVLSARQLQEDLALRIAELAFLAEDPLPRDEAAYQKQLERGRERIPPAVQDVTRLMNGLAESYHQARLARENASSKWRYAIEDVDQQLAQLMRRDFLLETPWAWLVHYPRYLRAIHVRLEKLPSAGARDQKAYDEIAPRQQAFLERAHQQRELGLHDPELELYGWMLEELRVSLFAQQLGTSMPISSKRLDQQWMKVRAV